MTAPRSRDAGDAQLEALGRAMEALLMLVALLLVLPGVLGGVLLALVLRVCRLHWTWGLLLALALALPLAVAPGERAARAKAAVVLAIDQRTVTLPQAAGVLWPFWLVVGGGSTVLVKRRLERRTRLHGGRGERELERMLDPVALARRAWRRRQARRTPLGGVHGTLVGETRIGEPVVVAPLRAHAMIVGGSGTGKTTTAQVLLEGE